MLPALGHDVTQYEGKEATCTESGWEAYEACSKCDYTTYKETPATGHSLTMTEAREATCTETGNSAYWTCSDCGKYFSDAEGKNEIEENSWVIPCVAIAITTQPADVCAATGTTAAFSVEAEGEDLTYQWQYSKDSGETWITCSSDAAKSASFEFKMYNSFVGRQYRCAVSNGTETVYSDAATLTNKTVDKEAAFAITSEPEATTAAITGKNVTLSVTATGNDLTYQWQRLSDGEWVDCTSSAAKKASFTFEMYKTFEGRQYRCVVTDAEGNTLVSNTTTLALTFAITNEPVSSVEAAAGDTVSIKVTASGDSLTYQWQYSKDGGETWTTCTSTASKKATFTFKMYKNFAGRIYRCVVTNAAGTSEEEVLVSGTSALGLK